MITIIFNFLTPHIYPLVENLYKLYHGEIKFIEMEKIPEKFIDNGFPRYNDFSWIIKGWDKKNSEIIKKLILDSEVVITTFNYKINLIRKRLNKGKLTFEHGERWLKRGKLNLLSPRLILSQIYYHLFFYNKQYYHLNASAYAANDFYLMHSFKFKMFKWGYFTNIPNINIMEKNNSDTTKIIYVSRFIKWKHPELAIQMAKLLKERNHRFILDMYGSGPELKKINKLIEKYNLQEFVKLKGNLPNQEIVLEMTKHNIFIITSDKNEGWGAVVNEAMSTKCGVVASNQIGSVPFLINDGINGLIFENGSVFDLTNKVEILINNPLYCKKLGEEAYKTISKLWSPYNAALNLLKLIQGLKDNNSNIIKEGPGSIAYPI